MQMRRATSSWNLAGRALLICTAFLIVPLFIHSFLQYRKEVQLEQEERKLAEQGARDTMKAIGWQMSQTIYNQIAQDWQVLDVSDCKATLAEQFHIQIVPTVQNQKDHFAYASGKQLVVGIRSSDTEDRQIVHPLDPLLFIHNPPFSITASLSPVPPSDWVETFRIAHTDLTLSLSAIPPKNATLHSSELIFRIISFIVLVGLFGGALVAVVLKKLARPLNVLRLTMDRVASGAVHSRYAPQKYGFEINTVGAYFNETLDALLRHQEEIEEERAAREKLAEKLRVAREIQASLLPKEFSHIAHLEIETAYLPALEVSGDFYDVISHPSGKTLIVLADVADKGISACLYSLGLRSSIRAMADLDLSQIIRKANDLFTLDAKETGQFATVWIGLLHNHTLWYASLGHPPALLKRKGQLQELSGARYPALGLTPLESVATQTVQLEMGDELLLYSDGVTEAHDMDNNLYGIEKLKNAFLKCGKHVADEILHDVQVFSLDVPQQDDLTLLHIRLR